MSELQELLQKIEVLVGKLRPTSRAAVDDAALSAHAALLGGHAAKTVDMAGDQHMEKDMPMDGLPVDAAAPDAAAECDMNMAVITEALAALDARVAALESGNAKIVADMQAALSLASGEADKAKGEIAQHVGGIETRLVSLEADVKTRASLDEIAALTKTADGIAEELRELTTITAGQQAKQGQREVAETPEMKHIQMEERDAGATIAAAPVFTFSR